ncbi:hypothetical protein BH09PSE6_BH09PSE6_08130 [soil metagenome]
MTLPAPRDPHLDAGYWKRWADYHRKSLAQFERAFRKAINRAQFRVDFQCRPACSLVYMLYSGGHPLADVAGAMREMFAIKRGADDDYRASQPYNQPYGLYGWGYETGYEAMLDELCWLVCLLDRESLLAYIARCNPAGDDRLFDLIVAKVDPTRVIAPALAFPKRFTLLLAAAEIEPEARPAALLKAFRTWKRRLPDKGLPPDGATTVVDGAHSGYWCWECALLAALFDIDDSALRSDYKYPADVVDHYRRRCPEGGQATVKSSTPPSTRTSS